MIDLLVGHDMSGGRSWDREDIGFCVVVERNGYPKAAHHKPNHDPQYHYEVYIRLQRGSNEAGGRIELKGMKKDLLAGRMSL